jgi:transposase
MRFVPIKNEAQFDLQALHRVRDRWIGRRTAVINQIRGFLQEHGITVAAGPAHLKRQIPALLEDVDNLLSPMRGAPCRASTRVEKLEELIQEVDHEFAEAAKREDSIGACSAAESSIVIGMVM